MSGFQSIPRAGPWSAETLEAYCRETIIPLRVSCIAPTQYPIVMSLWTVWQDGHFWCAVQEDSRLARYCHKNARCGYELAADAPPYRGLRGTADAELVSEAGPDILKQLIQRYLGEEKSELAQWLLSRVETEVALRLTPRRVFTWDYSKRMKKVAHADRHTTV